MYEKKKIALIAVLVCCMVAVGGTAYYGVSKNYKVPATDREATLPTGYSRSTTQVPLYTDATEPTPVTEDVASPISEPDSAVAATEENTESATVSGTLPRPGYFELPLGLDIVLDYSAAEPVFNSTMGDWRTHTGVDFGGVIGDPVKAAAQGFVTAVYDDPMYGVVMEIEYGGGVMLKYCGLGKGSTVPVGTEVKTNDTVGYLGTVPCESDAGAHLHMEAKDNGMTVDPLDIFELS